MNFEGVKDAWMFTQETVEGKEIGGCNAAA